MNSFPTSVSAESLVRRPAPLDREVERRSEFRKFWGIYVPLGAVIAAGLSILTGANVFFPGWGVASIVLWGIGCANKEGR